MNIFSPLKWDDTLECWGNETEGSETLKRRAIDFSSIVCLMSRGQLLWGIDSLWHAEILLFLPRNRSLDEFPWSVAFLPENYFKEHIRLFLEAEFSGGSEPWQFCCLLWGGIFLLHLESVRAGGEEFIWSSFLCCCCLFVSHIAFHGVPSVHHTSSIEVVNFVLIFYCFSSMQYFSLNSVTSSK